MIWLVSIGSVVVTAAASAALIVALRLRKAITQATLAAVSANTTLGEALKRLGALEASTSEASRLLAADTASQATKLDATIEANAAAINQLEQRLKAQSESNDAAWEAMRVALLERIDEGDKAGARALAQLAELVDSTNKALQSDITAVRVIAENATVQVAALGLKGKELSEAALMMATASGNLPVLVTAAIEEQVRRENEHKLPYTQAQRILAIQQRLSRALGAKAYSTDLLEQIQHRVSNHTVLGK
jgi:hypothetical protein